MTLPGADTWFDEKNNKVIQIASKLINQNVTVAAICGATLALAKSNLLNTRKHTSNDKDYLKMSCAEYSGEKFYLDSPVVVDGNLITATGLAPLDFSYEVLKRTKAIKQETLEAWYQLNKTKDSMYFYILLESLN